MNLFRKTVKNPDSVVGLFTEQANDLTAYETCAACYQNSLSQCPILSCDVGAILYSLL